MAAVTGNAALTGPREAGRPGQVPATRVALAFDPPARGRLHQRDRPAAAWRWQPERVRPQRLVELVGDVPQDVTHRRAHGAGADRRRGGVHLATDHDGHRRGPVQLLVHGQWQPSRPEAGQGGGERGCDQDGDRDTGQQQPRRPHPAGDKRPREAAHRCLPPDGPVPQAELPRCCQRPSCRLGTRPRTGASGGANGYPTVGRPCPALAGRRSRLVRVSPPRRARRAGWW